MTVGVSELEKWRLPRVRAGVWGTALVAAVVALPIIAVLVESLQLDAALWRHLADTVLADYVATTAALLAGVGLAVAFGGVATAWLVTMHRFPGRDLFEWALLLPLAMPAYVLAYTYTDLLQFAGPVQTALRQAFGWGRGDYWFPPVHSVGAAIVLFSAVLYPYVYALARAAFIEQSVCVLEVSRTLGRGPWATFFRVALPLARPAIAAGVAFALMETLADFGAVQYFGLSTFVAGIYRAWYALSSPPVAAQLASALLGFVLVVILLERLTRGAGRRVNASNVYRSLGGRRLGPVGSLAAITICAAPILVGFVIPALALLRLCLSGDLDIDAGRFGRVVAQSFLLAAGAAAVVAIVAVAVGFWVRADLAGIARGLARIASLGYATPGAVIAVGILIAVAWIDRGLGRMIEALTGQPPGLLVGGTLVALLYGYLARFFSVAYAPVESGLARIRPSLEAAARTLGCRPVAVLWRVHLPLMRPSVLSALALVFVDVMKELPATMILRPFNLDTLAVEAFRMATTERLAEAGLFSLVIVATGLVPVIILSRTITRSRPGGPQAGTEE